MPVTISAPHAGPSPPAHAILKRYTERPLGGISFRRPNAARRVSLRYTNPAAWPRSPDAPRTKAASCFRAPGLASAGAGCDGGDGPAGTAGEESQGRLLLISDSGPPCRWLAPCSAGRPRVPTLKDSFSARRTRRAVGQDGRSALALAEPRPALPSALCPALPAHPAPAPPNQAAHGRAAKARDGRRFFGLCL